MNAIPQRMIQTKVLYCRSHIESTLVKILQKFTCYCIQNVTINHESDIVLKDMDDTLTVGNTCNALFSQIAAVSAFAQTLRRYTSLNHLAQAARAVLQNTSQINQMLSDLNRVDFANVQVR